MASRREDLGSWLEGTPGGDGAEGASRLGLPAHGPGSRAPLPRRVIGLAVDWVASMAVSALLVPDPQSPAPWIFSGDTTATLLVFAVSTVVLVATLGYTTGHRVAGVRVVREADLGSPARAPGLRAALVRTVLLCLVIPAVVWDRAGRGMHDVAARTVLVRT